MREGPGSTGRVRGLVEAAREMYQSLAEPRGIWMELPASEFAGVYEGEARNASRTPLQTIFPRAERLALFAVTLGKDLSDRIRHLFDTNEPALAYVLDMIASERADRAAMLAAAHFLGRLQKRGLIASTARVLPYSPGYCGWDVTGQRKLFDKLHPEEIGITLNASCLMTPLKSVSGVLTAGSPEIHDFDIDFDFCESCATQECRERIASVLAEAPAAEEEKGSR
jgi:hypothetical protein